MLTSSKLSKHNFGITVSNLIGKLGRASALYHRRVGDSINLPMFEFKNSAANAIGDVAEKDCVIKNKYPFNWNN